MKLYIKDTFDFKRLLHEEKISMKKLSKELPIDYMYLSSIVNGRRSIGNEKSSAIAKYFDKEITDLFEFKEIKEDVE